SWVERSRQRTAAGTSPSCCNNSVYSRPTRCSSCSKGCAVTAIPLSNSATGLQLFHATEDLANATRAAPVDQPAEFLCIGGPRGPIGRQLMDFIRQCRAT